jgi:hypothetical protein
MAGAAPAQFSRTQDAAHDVQACDGMALRVKPLPIACQRPHRVGSCGGHGGAGRPSVKEESARNTGAAAAPMAAYRCCAADGRTAAPALLPPLPFCAAMRATGAAVDAGPEADVSKPIFLVRDQRESADVPRCPHRVLVCAAVRGRGPPARWRCVARSARSASTSASYEESVASDANFSLYTHRSAHDASCAFLHGGSLVLRRVRAHQGCLLLRLNVEHAHHARHRCSAAMAASAAIDAA